MTTPYSFHQVTYPSDHAFVKIDSRQKPLIQGIFRLERN